MAELSTILANYVAPTDGSTGNGSEISLVAGEGGAPTGGGGAFHALAGSAIEYGPGGSAELRGGDAAGDNNGGNARVSAGLGSGEGNGGVVQFTAGDAGTTGDGGPLILRGGDGGATSGNGGYIDIRPGSAGGGGSIGLVMMSLLPTSDPAVTGALWNDAGTMKISA